MQTEKSTNNNVIGGGNHFLYRSDNQYFFSSLEEIYMKSNNSKIFLPSLEPNGNQIWVKLEFIKFLGKSITQKIIPTNGLYFTTHHTAKVPVIVSVTPLRSDRYLQLRFKEIKNISKFDKLWFYSKLDIDIDNDLEHDYKIGFFIDFFLAEGNFIYYSNKIKQDSIFSRSALKRWSKEKGYKTVDDYLENRKVIKIKGLQISCGLKDLDKGYIKRIPFPTNINRYGSKIHVSIYDYKAIEIVRKYINGSTSKDKHLKIAAFNRSKKFIEGILDGFIAGDGYQEKTRISIGITSNFLLRDQLMILCKILGLQPRYTETFARSSKEGKKRFHVLFLRILTYKNRIMRNNVVYQNVRRIENYKLEKIYKLEIESRKSVTDEWNRLVILGNGVIIQV